LDALFPEMSNLSGSRDGLRRLAVLFQAGGRLLLIGGLLLAVVGALGAGGLVSLVFGQGDNYRPAVATFRLLVWALPAMFLYLLAGHTLYALRKQRQVTGAMLVVGLTNVSLNLVVIPRWSYLGAAVVALASEWLLWVLLYPQASQALAAAPELGGQEA
jgi:O-antigen/teichoic acid export membrane protein